MQVCTQHQQIHLPGDRVGLPALTKDDEADIQFGVDWDVDFIALSFVRNAEDVEHIRTLPGVREKRIKIISKIDTQEGFSNYEQIVQVRGAVKTLKSFFSHFERYRMGFSLNVGTLEMKFQLNRSP